MEEDAVDLCGPRYGREDGKAGHRWGKTKGKLGFHGGKVELERPRIRARNYVAAEDVYRCPAGERLTFRFTCKEKGSFRGQR